jgi:hypothetical protein
MSQKLLTIANKSYHQCEKSIFTNERKSDLKSHVKTSCISKTHWHVQKLSFKFHKSSCSLFSYFIFLLCNTSG